MKKVKTFLHVGGYKTGSTAIQSHFRNNRQHYLDNGSLLYPKTGLVQGSPGHYPFAQSMANRTAGARRYPDAPSLPDLIVGLRQEIAATNPEKVLLSSEVFLPSMDIAQDAVDPKLISDINAFEDSTVIFYARPPWEAVKSKYKQVVKSPYWKYTGTFEEFCKVWEPCANPQTLLRPWIDAFGHDAIDVRMYKNSLPRDHDIIADFANIIGISSLECGPQRRNLSFSMYATEKLRQSRIENGLPASDLETIAYLKQIDEDAGETTVRNYDKEFWNERAQVLAEFEAATRSGCDALISELELAQDFFD